MSLFWVLQGLFWLLQAARVMRVLRLRRLRRQLLDNLLHTDPPDVTRARGLYVRIR